MSDDELEFIVVGEKVALEPLRRDLAAVYARWMNELEVRRGLDYLGIAAPQSQEKWVEDAHGSAKFAIALGERRGQGLGTEATRLALDFAFHVLQLRNVMLETLASNVAALTAYERAGFCRVGVRRGARISRGRPTDVVIMDAVPEDFSASVLR